MSQRKPSKLDWEAYAEHQIREAQREGEFDRLPGMGKPFEWINEPYDELWWVKKRLEEEKLSVLPPTLEIKLVIDKTLRRIWTLASETQVRRELAALNEKIRKANFAAVDGPPSTTMPLEADEVVAEWRERRSGGERAGERPA